MAPRETNFHNGHMMPLNQYKSRNQAWIQEICDRLGITYTELARKAGIDMSTLTRFMNNPRYKHNLSDTTLQKIAETTRTPLPQDAATITRLPQESATSTVKVIGTAAAGLWKEVSIIVEDYQDYPEIPVTKNPRYERYRQYALRVEGNSINRQIPDGEFAICVAWDEIGADLKDGQFVHVERSRGGLHEVTIKQVRQRLGRWQLWPDSTDPRFQEPIELAHTDEDTEVVIKGLVIGSYREFG